MCGSVFTLRDWVHKYDDDAFDANLQGMGLAKIVWPADFGDADERVNKLVVERLGNLSREQLANATSRELFTLLREAQEELGVWHYRHGLSWAYAVAGGKQRRSIIRVRRRDWMIQETSS